MKAKIIINKKFETGEIDKRIYGSFVEHVGRVVYGGVYDPTHESADEHGFRGDVKELVKEMDVPIVRYPGGNFVSAYIWEDGTGDRALRPTRQDPTWKVIETNEFGIDEFQLWAKQVGAEIDMTVNLGTRGPADAQNLVEYCNSDNGGYYAAMRKRNGFEEPFRIKTWCLGNEMDGPWQIGQKTAEQYGSLAAETAKLMKRIDPSIELVVCGSTANDMPTFGKWDLTVLEHTYDLVDYISLHRYFDRCQYRDPAVFLARSVEMDEYIKTMAAICDVVKAEKHSKKTLMLAMDEWNVWSTMIMVNNSDDWSKAPPLLEQEYSFIDALLAGCMLITLQNNCDRVKIACLAQLVNAIAPIMTENGGKLWKQTIFYPFVYASRYGRGKTLKSVVSCDTYNTDLDTNVPYLEASVINNEKNRELVVFAVNRSLEENMELSLDLDGFENAELIEHIELYSDDLDATNTKECQSVHPVKVETAETGSCVRKACLNKHSWNMLRFSY